MMVAMLAVMMAMAMSRGWSGCAHDTWLKWAGGGPFRHCPSGWQEWSRVRMRSGRLSFLQNFGRQIHLPPWGFQTPGGEGLGGKKRKQHLGAIGTKRLVWRNLFCWSKNGNGKDGGIAREDALDVGRSWVGKSVAVGRTWVAVLHLPGGGSGDDGGGRGAEAPRVRDACDRIEYYGGDGAVVVRASGIIIALVVLV